MKRKHVGLWLGLLMAVQAHAQPGWLIPSDTTLDQARKAKRENVSAIDATSTLIMSGRDPAQVVQAVVRTYDSCAALSQSVEAGTRLAPHQSQAIVEAVNALPCLCSADSIWPHTRLEARIRPEAPRTVVSVAPTSICLSAASEAAVRGAPQVASEIIKGAIDGTRSGGSVLDSVGQIGSNPEFLPASQNLKLDPDRNDGCVQDVKLTDEFRPDRRFAQTEQVGELIEAGKRCDRAIDLLIDGVATAMSDNTAVVLRNDTGQVIDLGQGGYALEVYFAGNDVPGRKVGLEGTVNPGTSFVVASPESDAGIRQVANLITPSVRISPGDSVVLKRGTSINDCRGVATSMAAIANTLGTELGTQWIEELQREFESRQALRTVDSVGQAGADARMWQGAMAGQVMTLKRENDLCESDLEPSDGFSVSGGWRGDGNVDAADLGNSEARCAAKSADLVISKYANAAEQYRAVELLNNTSGDVDLAAAGYLLEVYAEGAAEPTRTIALEGKVGAGKAFVVSDRDAPSEVRERSQLVSADLGLQGINALVLRKVGVATSRACAAEVIALTRNLDQIPVEMALINPMVPSIEPGTATTGGEVASPN